MMLWLSHLHMASAPASDQLFRSVLPWAVALIVLAFVGAIVIYATRRLLKSDESDEAPGFTLQSLRELRDQGEITEEEFAKARQSMISQVQGSTPMSDKSPDKEQDAGSSDNPAS